MASEVQIAYIQIVNYGVDEKSIIKLEYHSKYLLSTNEEVIKYLYLTGTNKGHGGFVRQERLEELYKLNKLKFIKPTPAMKLLYEDQKEAPRSD